MLGSFKQPVGQKLWSDDSSTVVAGKFFLEALGSRRFGRQAFGG